MSPQPTVFLDTTILVDYAVKDKRRSIDAILKGKEVYASTYSKMEIKKGVLQYYVYLHTLLIETGSFKATFESVQKLSATPAKYRLSTTLDALVRTFTNIKDTRPTEILKKYGDIPSDEFLYRESLSYIRSSIIRLSKVVDSLPNKVLNPMRCFEDIEPPKQPAPNKTFDNKPTTCKNSKKKCLVNKFFIDNEPLFENIKVALESHTSSQQSQGKGLDRETVNRVRSLKENLRLMNLGGRELSNQNRVKDCWNCSDAILCLIPSQTTVIFHNNPKDFPTILNAINRNGCMY